MLKAMYTYISNVFLTISMRFRPGYTLVELSVSTSILALLAVGGLSVVQKKNEADAIRDTESKIRSIRNALDKFVRINGYVPCPADPSLAEDHAYFGRDEKQDTTSGTTTSIYDTQVQSCVADNIIGNAGMLPVRILNLSDEMAYDGWERKFTYKIASQGADKEAMDDPLYRGDIRVIDLLGNNKTGIDSPPPNNQGALYVLISHGANGINAAWPRVATSSSSVSAVSPDKNKVSGYERQNMLHERGIYIQDRKQQSFDDMIHFSSKYNIKPPKKIMLPVSMHEDACSNAKLLKDRPSLIEGLNSNDETKRHIIEAATTLNILCSHTTQSITEHMNVEADSIALWLDSAQPTADGSDLSLSEGTWFGKYGAVASLGGTPYGGDYHINGIPAFAISNKSIVISSIQNGVDIMGKSYSTGSIANHAADDNALKHMTFFISLKTAKDVTEQQTIFSYADSIALSIENSMMKVVHPGGTVLSEGVAVQPDRTYTIGFTTGAAGETLVLQQSRVFSPATALSGVSKGGDFRIGSMHAGGFKGLIGEVVVMKQQIDPKAFYAAIAKMDETWQSNFNFTSEFSPIQCPYMGQEYIATSTDPERKCQCPEGKVLNNQMDARNACIKDGNKIGQCVDIVDYDTKFIEENINAGGYRLRLPRNLSQLALWLDAADCTTVELDKGRKVVSWRDKSNNGNHFYATDIPTAPAYNYVQAANTEYGAVTFGGNQMPTHLVHKKCEGSDNCRDLDLGANQGIASGYGYESETGYSVFVVSKVNMKSMGRGRGTTFINHGNHHWGLKLDDYGRPFNYAAIKEGNGLYSIVNVYNPLHANRGGNNTSDLGNEVLYETTFADNNFHIFHGHVKWICDSRAMFDSYATLADSIIFQGGAYSTTDVFLDNNSTTYDKFGVLKSQGSTEKIEYHKNDTNISSSVFENILEMSLNSPGCWSLKSSETGAMTTIGNSQADVTDPFEVPFVGEIGEIIVTQKTVLRDYAVHQEIYRYLACKWQGKCTENYTNALFE